MSPIVYVLGGLGLFLLTKKRENGSASPVTPVTPVVPRPPTVYVPPITPVTPVMPPTVYVPPITPVTPRPPTPTKPGTNVYDSYGATLIQTGSLDEIYSYATSSTSIPFVRDAASKLAAAGDTRAMELTIRLAYLEGTK
jgi:hypothetical protein